MTRVPVGRNVPVGYVVLELARVNVENRKLKAALKEIAADPISYDGLEECDNGSMCVNIAQRALDELERAQSCATSAKP